MTGPDIVAVISGIAAVLSALYARHAWVSARHAILHQALMDIHADYRSAEMLDAVKSLWEFYRRFGKGRSVEEYEKVRATDDEALAKLPPNERVDFLKATLHYKRRLVSHFYLHLADLYVNKILPKDVLYASWNRGDWPSFPRSSCPSSWNWARRFVLARRGS